MSINTILYNSICFIDQPQTFLDCNTLTENLMTSCLTPRVFLQNFWWGALAFRDDFFGPRRGQSQMGGLTSGTESAEGGPRKIVR